MPNALSSVASGCNILESAPQSGSRGNMRLRGIVYLRAFAMSLLFFWAAASAPSLLAQPVVAGGAGCDRACLEGMVDKYLNAMVAHDPSRAPLSPTVKFAQDNVPLKIGTALWT